MSSMPTSGLLRRQLPVDRCSTTDESQRRTACADNCRLARYLPQSQDPSVQQLCPVSSARTDSPARIRAASFETALERKR
jgi:hypothetical protein